MRTSAGRTNLKCNSEWLREPNVVRSKWTGGKSTIIIIIMSVNQHSSSNLLHSCPSGCCLYRTWQCRDLVPSQYLKYDDLWSDNQNMSSEHRQGLVRSKYHMYNTGCRVTLHSFVSPDLRVPLSLINPFKTSAIKNKIHKIQLKACTWTGRLQ